ncbi:calcium proton exchanger [Armillaria novae-zelandiae]|uniref:Calcium proton exchanger n=1 Tax=Armillaria novae-zelandiae TaxID=153914 RepID=A0AA39UMR1_9AGAR|nr:calcium proton exchanger [Armillaria novae-zelandiae]
MYMWAHMENTPLPSQSSEHIAKSDDTDTNSSSEFNAGTNIPPITAPLHRNNSAFRRQNATGDTVNGINSRRFFSLAQATSRMLQPEKEVGLSPGVWKSLRSILLASWLNPLLIFIPVSWALHFAFAGEKDSVIFHPRFISCYYTLGQLLAFATDELSLRVGQTLAGLLNATFGNTVELIVAIISLTKCELQIVQSSLVGSILINLLLVLGMCFFAGGIKFQEQGFGHMATRLSSSLLAISIIAVLLPAAFHFLMANNIQNDETSDILNVSYGTSIVLLFIYISYLVFQLFSHASFYADEGEEQVKSTCYPKKKAELETPETSAVSSPTSTVVDPPMDNSDIECGSANSEEKETKQPQLGIWVTVGLLIVVTVLVAVTVNCLIESVNGLVQYRHISKEFVGVIILPFVCRAPDGVTIVTTSVQKELNFSMGIAIGSSIQIALSVIPFIVLLGWMMGKPLTLLFDPYESITMFLTGIDLSNAFKATAQLIMAVVLTVNYVVLDNKSNWLEGMILICLYVILCITFWYYPGNNPFNSVLASCT